MPQISSSVGIVSGINYGQLISEMMQLDSQPIQVLQTRIASINTQQNAYADLQTRLTSLQSTVQLLAKPSTIQNPTANSSNTSVLNATASAGTTPGTYQFQVARLVSTQQMITSGFSDQLSTSVGATTQTLKAGSGPLTNNPALYQLNGGTGVGAGTFKITDADGNTATFSTNGVANLSTIINNINANTTIDVAASVTANGIQLTDKSGGTGTLTVTDGDSQNVADKLGLTNAGGASQTGNVITGGNINTLGPTTSIQSLNGGLGVQGVNGNDFQVTTSDGGNFSVNLTSLNTIDDVISAINDAAGNTGAAQVTASLSGSSLVLTDAGGGTITVSALNGSTAAKSLGILGTSTGNVLTGQSILSPLNSVFISSLNGGAGLTMGAFTVTNKDGTHTIDLSNLNGNNSVQDIIDAINNTASTTGVRASLNSAQNGIEISNAAGGTLTIANADSNNIATQLGIVVTGTSTTTVQGQNLGLAQVSAGSISIEQGGAELNDSTPLTALNGGKGVSLGKIRISDAAGQSDIIDLSSAVTIDDVLQQINSALDVNVTATVTDKGIVVTDNSTGSGSLSISNVGGDSTATSLGLTNAASSGTIAGSSIYYLGAATSLSQLNDGLGVRLTTDSSGNNFQVTLANGSVVDVDLSGAKTMGDVINDINTSGGGKLVASINASTNALQLTDNTTGSGTLTVSNTLTSEDLGLTDNAAVGNTISGSAILGGMDTVMLSSLNGGAGLTTGTVNFINRSGQAATVDFSNATTMQDVLNDINNATDSGGNSLHLSATLNSTGTGIQISDNSGGSGNLVIADSTGTFASQLGVAGTYDTSVSAVTGGNLNRQFVNANTSLSNYNFGNGVNLGTFRITNSLGNFATINLAASNPKTIGDVITAINSAKDASGHSLGVTASINSTGNGIILNDSSGGTGTMTVTDVSGTAASDLQIAGTATSNAINGAMQKTIQLTPTDTLSAVAQKINALNFGVRASVINDGSPDDPYHLSLSASNAGYEGRFIFDGGTTQLGATQLVAAQDAAVFVGSNTSSSAPLLVTSKTNQVSGIIPGLSVSLVGTSSSPVTVNVTTDDTQAVTQINTMVQTFNGLIDDIANYSTFNTSTDQGGVLLGDYNTQNIQTVLYDTFNTIVPTTQQYHSLADIGFSFNQQGELQFDQSTFDQAYASNPSDVQKLLTATNTTTATDGTQKITPVGIMSQLSTALSSLLDPTDGLLAQENNTLNSQSQNFQDQITEMNKTLANKQNLLEQQFANLETTLASLQSQGQTISSFAANGSSSSSSSKSS